MPEIKFLATSSDSAFGTIFEERLYSVTNPISTYELPPTVRYYIEGLLVVSRIMTEPSPVRGKLIPNQFVLREDGNLLTQFDAISIPRSMADQIPQNGRMIETIWEKRIPWIGVQIKTPLRPRDVTGEINKVPKGHVDEVKDQLGRVIVERFKRGHKFHLPTSFDFVYLRGLKETKAFKLPINLSFIRSWLIDIENTFDEGELSKMELIQTATLMQFLAEQKAAMESTSQLRFEQRIAKLKKDLDTGTPTTPSLI